MRCSISRPGLVLIATLAVPATFAHAEELTADQLPKPVAETVAARWPDLKITNAGKEKAECGNLIYEVSLDDKGMNIDATLSPEGALVLIEKQIDRKELPEAIAKTLDTKYPKARYRLVEAVTSVKNKEETLAYYEVLLITPQKQIRSVEVGLDGKILKIEKKATEDED